MERYKNEYSIANQEMCRKEKKEKKAKDPNKRPKKYMTPFFYYLSMKREQIKNNPNGLSMN